MSTGAHVTSLEAIEAFRAKLIVYREKAGRVLDEVADEVTRTRLWLDHDCTARWQREIRARGRELEMRQQELFSAQLSGLLEASALQQAAVHKARRAIRAAEEKLQTVKQWRQQFDHRVEPAAKQVEKLRHYLGHELGLAVADLAEISRALAAYAELSPVSAAAPPKPAPPEGSAAP
jgi:predicted transcriptional regulator